MPVNPKTGQRYRISDDGRNRLHIYGTPGKKGVRRASADYRVVRMARPKGYLYNPKNTQYYKVQESKGGLTKYHVYQNGRKVNMGAGSAWGKAGLPSSYYQKALNTWNITNQPTIDALSRNKGRERSAQDQAYRQIAGYYSGLGKTTTDLMGQAGQVGAQTDAQVKAIGQDRNAQVQAATPQYGGPLGMVAQRMADSEEQAAMNRGASADAANRTYGVQVSGNRQALLGQVGAGQAVAGQERLSVLKGQGNQALQSYTDKINEIEGQKPAKILDTARQLQYDDQALGVKQYGAETDRLRALKPPAPSGGSGGGSGGGSSPRKPKPKDGSTWYDGVDKGVSLARRLANVNLGSGHSAAGSATRWRNVFRDLINQGKMSREQAVVAWDLVFRNGQLGPEAVKIIHRRGFRVGSRYGVDRTANVSRPFPL